MKSQVLEVHAPGDATVELAFRDEVTYYREPWLILYLFLGVGFVAQRFEDNDRWG